MSRVGVVVCGLLAACGGSRASPGAVPAATSGAGAGSGATAAAPTVPDATPAPRPDPLSEASIVADLEWLTAPERHGRGSLTDDARAVAGWLEAELRAAGYQPTTQPIDRAAGQVNVIAIRDATADGAATVMVSAHYDHLGERGGAVYPGADDNASGVAVALAVARALRTDAGLRDAPGRVVFVFTGAEEVGLLGALAYADAPAVPLADTALAINLDMVGRRLFESAIDRDAALGAIDVDRALAPIADAAAATAGLQLVTATPAMVKLIGQDWRSDDWVFRDRGVRAVHLSTGLHDDYHKPTDTLDKLSRPQLVRITAFLYALVGATAR